MKTTYKAIIGVLSITLGSACGDAGAAPSNRASDATDDSTGAANGTRDPQSARSGSAALVGSMVEERNAQLDTFCDCYDGLGFDSKSACTSAQDMIGPSKLTCIEEAHASDEIASKTFLDCVVELEQNFSACIDQRLDCQASEAGMPPCVDDYQIGLQRCIELPPAVRRDLDNCGVTAVLVFRTGETGGSTGGASSGGNGSTGGVGTGGEGGEDDPAGEENPPVSVLCDDSCPFAFDGICDDGGLGALYDDCLLGSDCFDCGWR